MRKILFALLLLMMIAGLVLVSGCSPKNCRTLKPGEAYVFPKYGDASKLEIHYNKEVIEYDDWNTIDGKLILLANSSKYLVMVAGKKLQLCEAIHENTIYIAPIDLFTAK